MQRILGIDAGIASVGFALVEMPENDTGKGRIVRCGSHIFDAAENPKDGASLAMPRRIARSQRRRLDRKRRRLDAVERLFVKSGFTGLEARADLTARLPELSPWQLRSEALSRPLDDIEFSRVLFHIAKRRGFKSSRKDAEEQDSEGKKMLAGIDSLCTAMVESDKETVGAYLATLEKPLNSDGGYERTVTQQLTEAEVRTIFARQAELGNLRATDALRDEFIRIAFHRRPLKSSLDLVGFCSLEPTEKRAPKMAYHAELFVLWSRLNSLRILSVGKKDKRLLELAEKKALVELAHKNKGGVTFAQVRKELGLSDQETFNLVSYRNTSTPNKPQSWEELRDKSEKGAKLTEMKGYQSIRKAVEPLGEQTWIALRAQDGALDKIAYAHSFFEEEQDIRDQLSGLDLPDPVLDAVMTLRGLAGTIDHSLKAVRKLLPCMQQEQDFNYSDACDQLYPGHRDKNKGLNLIPPFEDVRNPVVNRALSQCRKVINAIIRRHGMPDRIHVELARELGRSFKDRKAAERENKKNREYKEDLRLHAKEIFGREIKGQEFYKYRLWKEQNGYCLYSGEYIAPETLAAANGAEIDHALPYSRSWDDSWSNKVLCLTQENRNKKNYTPFEYLNPRGLWPAFEAAVANLPYSKRRKLLTQKFDPENEKQWKERSLTDTRYITRLLKNHIEESLEPPEGNDGKLFVHTRNGGLTDRLRHLWGLGQKSRDNHRHHALDAVITACATTSVAQRVANWNRHDRKPGEKSEAGWHPPMPWGSFREEVLAAVADIFVSRMPARKGGGAIHKDTIKSLRHDDEGKMQIVKRVGLSNIKLSDLPNIVDVDVVDGQARGRNRHLYYLLKERLDEFGGKADKAFVKPLFMPTKNGSPGPEIKSVRLITKDQSGVEVPGRSGIADNGDMVRTDVFEKQGKYYLCPVYVKDLMAGNLPNNLIAAGKAEQDWPDITDEHHFVFSLYKNDYVMLEKPNGEMLEGYFAGSNRSKASIAIRAHDFAGPKIQDGIGVQRMKSFRKFTVNYFGERHEVTAEKRCFHLP